MKKNFFPAAAKPVILLCLLALALFSGCNQSGPAEDRDGDGIPQVLSGLKCDCDDQDVNNWTSCASCLDQDGDLWFKGCDAYVTIPGPDCDDANVNIWTGEGACVDTDGDGRFFDCDDYVTVAGPDCDDTDANAWDSCGTCVDSDGDGRYFLCNDYQGIAGPDCDDANANAWDSCVTCGDADADGAYQLCDQYLGIAGPDCDDADETVYPGAPEYCDDLDNNCPGDAGYGQRDESCQIGEFVEEQNGLCAFDDGSYDYDFITDMLIDGSGKSHLATARSRYLTRSAAGAWNDLGEASYSGWNSLGSVIAFNAAGQTTMLSYNFTPPTNPGQVTSPGYYEVLTWDGAKWVKGPVYAGRVGLIWDYYPSRLVYDASWSPHFVASNFGFNLFSWINELRYYSISGANLTYATVLPKFSTSSVPTLSALALDRNQIFHTAFIYPGTYASIKIRKKSGANWTEVESFNSGGLGGYSGLDLLFDSVNQPRVLGGDLDQLTLYYKQTGTWKSTVIYNGDLDALPDMNITARDTIWLAYPKITEDGGGHITAADIVIARWDPVNGLVSKTLRGYTGSDLQIYSTIIALGGDDRPRLAYCLDGQLHYLYPAP